MPLSMTDAEPLFILCGGLGTRLQDVLGTTPKILMPVGSRDSSTPLLNYLIHDYTQLGFTRIILLVGHQGQQVRQHLQEELRLSTPTVLVHEDPFPECGTGLAVLSASERLGYSRFWLAFGDARLGMKRLPRVLREPRRGSTMLVKRCRLGGNVALEKGKKRVLKYEKGKGESLPFFEYGLTFLDLCDGPETVNLSKKYSAQQCAPLDLGDLYRNIIAKGAMNAQVVRSRVQDLGDVYSYGKNREHRSFRRDSRVVRK